MEFDDVFQYIGDIGIYQGLLFFIIGLINTLNGLQNIGVNFIAGHQDHWCSVPRLEAFPHDVQKLVSIPHVTDNPDEYDTCSYYDLDYDNLTDDQIWNWDRNLTQNESTISCDAWVFDKSVFISTINSKVGQRLINARIALISSTCVLMCVISSKLVSTDFITIIYQMPFVYYVC
jgi:hypothetical protein